ncbi:DUF2711 domain-containing protein [Vibrio profundum]|uniref:DUF2711 family protein n=1 Tax=Vibrio profundum TaxID=2910247 RepID=UPI003D10AB10
MTNKVLPAPEKFASCPYDEKILPFYEGQFESVYVMLHPFLKPTSLDVERFCPKTWPTKHEILDGCSAISWQEILDLTKLSSLSDIDVGLRTSIRGIKKELSSQEAADNLNSLSEELDIICPTEGHLPPMLENRLFRVIKTLGYDWLWVGDEFGTERKLHWVDDLIKKDEIPSHGCVFTHDHRLLITTHWDSHCSFLCSSRELIEKILSAEPVEGFYCTPKTEVYWGAYEI